MAIDVKVPSLGEGVESGDVLDIFVSVGDQIDKDQDILELEVDKGTVAVPSSVAGKITAIHVSEGDSVAIGAVMISVEAAEGAAAPPPAAAPPAPAPAPPAPVAEAQATPAPPPAPAPTAPPASASPAPASPAPAPVAPVATAVPAASPSAPGARVPAGPAVRKFAREVGVDLQHVVGTGPGGRIIREDVLKVVRAGGTTSVSAAPAAPAATQAATGLTSPSPQVEGQPGTDPWGPVTIQKAPKIRRTIASKMSESWTTVPRVTNFDDADVTELEAIRQSSKEDYKAAGIKLTSMPFLIKSVAMALRHHPAINASLDLDNGQVIYKHYINVGIAVDTDSGLMVPSLREADDLSISEIARNLATIASNVRSNKFSIADLKGSTFTISNLGAIGGTYSTPIVNTPEVAILLVGRSRKMPVVVDDEVKVRLMMPLSLSYDHRLVDGGAAARFLNDVIGYLEAPSRLLLAP